MKIGNKYIRFDETNNKYIVDENIRETPATFIFSTAIESNLNAFLYKYQPKLTNEEMLEQILDVLTGKVGLSIQSNGKQLSANAPLYLYAIYEDKKLIGEDKFKLIDKFNSTSRSILLKYLQKGNDANKIANQTTVEIKFAIFSSSFFLHYKYSFYHNGFHENLHY